MKYLSRSTLGPPLSPGPGPWTLKNMNPEKHGINMGLKNMSAFRKSNKENTQCDFSLKVHVLSSISNLNFPG